MPKQVRRRPLCRNLNEIEEHETELRFSQTTVMQSAACMNGGQVAFTGRPICSKPEGE
ncbi:hypothetical protein GCM10023082_50180 [Streptomyces tremellae]|uniref:Uncharacterized protein n=1 Tax=Streptomyces tremellae TaxID=1124239 RepID=A0ABP7FWQ2_9ACTN